jgi:hypothetical protein
MIKVYKPGEKRKSVVVLRSVRRVAVTSCERGTPVCVVMTWAVRSTTNSNSSSSKRVAGPHHAAPHELRVSSRESQSTMRPLSHSSARLSLVSK